VTFLDPGFFFLLVPVAVWLFFGLKPSRRRALDFPAAAEALEAGTTWRVTTRWLPTLLLAAGFCLLVIALARPVEVRTEVALRPEGIDLVVLVDRSSSMGENVPGADLSTLALLEEVAAHFVCGRENDRIALVAFARTPETLCAFSLDQRAVAERLRTIEAVGRNAGEDGTAIGAGLAEAARLLEGRRAESRVVVLFTDGEENRFVIEPLAAARLCAARGVRVHTVALDLNRSAPDRNRSAPGDEELDTGLHERIAAITGGEFFRVGDRGDLDRVFHRLDGMEKSPSEGRRFPVHDDRFRRAALPGAFLLLLALGLKRFLYREAP